MSYASVGGKVVNVKDFKSDHIQVSVRSKNGKVTKVDICGCNYIDEKNKEFLSETTPSALSKKLSKSKVEIEGEMDFIDGECLVSANEISIVGNDGYVKEKWVYRSLN